MNAKRIALVCAAMLTAAAAPARSPIGSPVPLQAQPGTPLDAAARQLAGEDLAAAAERGDNPLVLIGTARLGGDRPAMFIQLQSPQECGSAGCTTSVYAFIHGRWTRVLDGTSGHLAVAPTKTRGWTDLLSDKDRYIWTGSQYRSTRPAPAVNLRPRESRHLRR